MHRLLSEPLYQPNDAILPSTGDYLVRFSFTRFWVRMATVSCRYFISGETACKSVTRTHSGDLARWEKSKNLRRHC